MTSLCRSLLFLYLGSFCGLIGDGQNAFSSSDSAPTGRQTSNVPEWVQRGTYTEGTDTWLVVRTKHPFQSSIAADEAIEPAIRNAIQQIKKQQVRDRLKLAGAGGAGLLALLAIVFGYFRIDHATRGFYSRRLQTLCIIAALLVVLLVCWIMLN